MLNLFYLRIMRFWPSTIASKTSCGIAVLNVFFIVTFTALLSNAAFDLVLRNGVSIHAHLAPLFAERLGRSVNLPADEPKIRALMNEFLSINRPLDIYLLDSSGKILLASAPELQLDKIPLSLLARDVISYDQPIRGADPSTGEAAVSPFTFARLSINGAPGYVYVNLFSGRNVQKERVKVWEFGALWFLYSFLQIALFVGTLTILVRKFVVRPLRKITKALTAFEQGDFTSRISLGSDDELSLHARTYNSMADTVQESVAALKTADQQRRDLMAGISHDLGAPLTSSIGQVHHLIQHADTVSPPELVRKLTSVGGSLNKIVRLTEDLFELAKLDSRQDELTLEPFSLLDMFTEELVPRFSETARSAGLSLQAAVPDQLPLAVGNEHLLERAVSNLVDNAIRYSPSGGTVTIGLTQLDKLIRVNVSDTGLGIPEAALPHIFKQFYRVESDDRSDKPGSGLGLAIVQRVIEAHGSEIHVESKVGRGTTFWFDLPIAESVDR